MSSRIHPRPNHVDVRGYITDLVVEPLDSATLVFTHRNAVRGNHYHERTCQWVYLVNGGLRVATRDVDADAEPRYFTLAGGSMMVNPPLQAHAWQALEDTLAVVLTRGPRAGEDYEKDTIHLPREEWLIGRG